MRLDKQLLLFDGDTNLKSRMCDPQVLFCERFGGAISRAYSAHWPAEHTIGQPVLRLTRRRGRST